MTRLLLPRDSRLLRADGNRLNVHDGVLWHPATELPKDERELIAGWHKLLGTRESPSDQSACLSVATRKLLSCSAPRGRPSLAVLGFVSVGPSRGETWLTGGLSADLSCQLARLPQLSVIAHASAARLTAHGLTPREIGERLAVRYLVRGTVQRDRARVRVTLSLIDSRDESEIWSDRVERTNAAPV